MSRSSRRDEPGGGRRRHEGGAERGSIDVRSMGYLPPRCYAYGCCRFCRALLYGLLDRSEGSQVVGLLCSGWGDVLCPRAAIVNAVARIPE